MTSKEKLIEFLKSAKIDYKEYLDDSSIPCVETELNALTFVFENDESYYGKFEHEDYYQ